jgi:hypothetical protein
MIKANSQGDPSTLEKRETEIHRLMRQMKSDNLHNSPVYRKLQQELEALKNNLIGIS